MRLIAGLLSLLLVLTLSCGERGESSSESVSVARIRVGEKVDGRCGFGDDLSQYPVTYSGISADCVQAVSIGPLTLAELEDMQRQESSFWENSFPYQQALVGEWIDGECQFTSPTVRAYLEFSEPSSTDLENCVMIVDVGPVTEKQIEEVERHGSVSSETAVPVAVPATTVPEPRR